VHDQFAAAAEFGSSLGCTEQQQTALDLVRAEQGGALERRGRDGMGSPLLGALPHILKLGGDFSVEPHDGRCTMPHVAVRIVQHPRSASCAACRSATLAVW
jgi:hypothetical protein